MLLSVTNKWHFSYCHNSNKTKVTKSLNNMTYTSIQQDPSLPGRKERHLERVLSKGDWKSCCNWEEFFFSLFSTGLHSESPHSGSGNTNWLLGTGLVKGQSHHLVLVISSSALVGTCTSVALSGAAGGVTCLLWVQYIKPNSTNGPSPGALHEKGHIRYRFIK